MKKSLFLFVPALLILSLISVSGINLQIQKNPVSDVVIKELNKPAIFNFNIYNLGETDYFEIYSLVSGVDIGPRGTFQINTGQTKQIEVSVFLNDRFKSLHTSQTSFSYKILGQHSGIQEDTLDVNIVSFKDAINVESESINPESESAKIIVENKVNFNFSEIRAEFNSAFFSKEQPFSLPPLGRVEINIPIDKEKMKKLVAGSYIITSEFNVDNVKQDFESTIKFTEKSGLSTTETSSGILFRDKTVEKKNEGNVPKIAEITLKKDVISRLFTTFSTPPYKSERNWFVVTYFWSKEVKPDETFSVTIKTNYLYPLIIIIFILLGVVLIRMYTASDLVLEKKVNYVKTKGGEFALKVTVIAKAKRYVEKISVVDRLPAMVKLYERFGMYIPKFDAKTRRLEWDIDGLQPGEERIFSYIVYSKIGILGKFELPAATAIYERDGKIKETASNKAFFMHEPRRREE